MLQFKDIELEDKEWVVELLSYSDYNATEYNFTVLYLWKDYFNTRICRHNDYLLIRSHPSWASGMHYILPAGRGSDAEFKEVIELYREDAAQNKSPFCIFSVLPSQKQKLELLYPDKFTYTPLRDSYDYIYNAADLLYLKGKKYQSKRNHINKFKSTYNWEYELLNSSNLEECKQMARDWCAQFGGCADGKTLEAEADTVIGALDSMELFGLKGGVLKVDGKVVGFTLAERLNSDTLIVHIEKAFASVSGAYPTIANEFLKSLFTEFVGLDRDNAQKDDSELLYKYINREDDAGNLRLREAKMQYHPAFLLEKFLVKEI